MKQIITLALLCLVSLMANAQTKIEVRTTDGSTQRINISDVQSMNYVDTKSMEDLTGFKLNWISSTETDQFHSSSVALSPDQATVYAVSNDHYLRAYNAKSGVQKWAFNLRDDIYGKVSTGNVNGTPSVDTDGTIYIGDGETDGKLFAINSDGTLKWYTYNDPTTGFWNKGQVPNANITCQAPVITEKYIFIGNRGSSGTVCCFDKTNGHRIGYASHQNQTNNGPAGGVISDLVVTKQGTMYIYNNKWGFYTLDIAGFKGDGNNAPTTTSNLYSGLTNNWGSSAADADGNCFINIYSSDSKHNVFKKIDPTGKEIWSTEITDAGCNDQGGIVVGLDNHIYVALNPNNGSNGGIACLDANTGAIKWHYGEAKVSCAPAVAANGDIVFMTESGYCIVLDPNGNKLAAVDLGAMAEDQGDALGATWGLATAKVWSAPVIANDGTIYVGVTKNADRTHSNVMSFTTKYVTGPANSSWPMRGGNAQHTCLVK